MARDTPDESVPLELIIPGNAKRGSLVSSRFVDLATDGLSNGHSNVPVQKPLKLKNLISKGEAFDSLHHNSTKVSMLSIIYIICILYITKKSAIYSNSYILIETKHNLDLNFELEQRSCKCP